MKNYRLFEVNSCGARYSPASVGEDCDAFFVGYDRLNVAGGSHCGYFAAVGEPDCRVCADSGDGPRVVNDAESAGVAVGGLKYVNALCINKLMV